MKCECKNTETQRIKDIILDTNNGERTITIYILYCVDCGDVVTIDY
jgi:hypothetical protein